MFIKKEKAQFAERSSVALGSSGNGALAWKEVELKIRLNIFEDF